MYDSVFGHIRSASIGLWLRPLLPFVSVLRPPHFPPNRYNLTISFVSSLSVGYEERESLHLVERLTASRQYVDSGEPREHLDLGEYPVDSDVNGKNDRGQTGLHVAVLNGDVSKVVSLLKSGASASKTDALGLTPLHYCACHSHRDEKMIKLLVESGAALNERDQNSRTPFALFCVNPSPSVFKYLLSRNPSLLVKDNENWTPLHFACAGGIGVGMLESLVQNRAPLAVDKRGRTPLHLACSRGHEEIVKYLVQTAGAQVNVKDVAGWTPLSMSVANSHVHIASWLIEVAKADILVANVRGWTILHVAASLGNSGMVRLALQQNVPVNAVDVSGRSALHYTMAQDFDDISNLLIRHGADADLKDARGWTPAQLKRKTWAQSLWSCQLM